MKTSQSCRQLATQALRWNPSLARIETDSILAIRFYMLAESAEKLEKALSSAIERQREAAVIAAYISRRKHTRSAQCRRISSCPPPIFRTVPQSISPAVHAALCVFGD